MLSKSGRSYSIIQFIFPVFLVIFAQNSGNSQTGIQFLTSWEEALAEAAKTNKLVFLDAYTTWCGPCKLMDRNVFSDGTVAAFYNEHFVNLKLDMEQGIGQELANQHRVYAYPSMLYFDAFGKLLHRAAGYRTPPTFIQLGEAALDPNRQLTILAKKFEGGYRDPDFLANYAIACYEAMDKRYQEVAEAYMETQQNWSTETNLKFIYRMVADVNSSLFQYMQAHVSEFEAIFGKQEVAARMEELIYNSVYELGENPELEEVDQIFESAYPQKAAMMSARYRIRYYYELDNMAEFAKATEHYVDHFAADQPDELNDAAWTFFEMVDDPAMLKKAVKWAKKSYKLEKSYFAMDTLAALYLSLEKKRKGIKAAKKAIKLAKEEGEDYSATENLLEALKAL